MKLRGGKKAAPARQPLGRQRREPTSWQSAAFSYHAQRSQRPDDGGRKQSSLAEKRRTLLSLRFWARRSGLLIAILVALICAVSVLSLSSQPRIVLLDDDTNGYAFHDAATYQRAAAAQLGSSFWNKNKITVNTGAASVQLRKEFPELEQVSITLPLIGHRPIYYLRANRPAFAVHAVNGTFVIDSSGKALLSADSLPEPTIAKLPILTDQTGTQVKLGQQVISSQKTLFMQTVVKTLAAKNVSVLSLVLPPNAAQELDVRLNGQPYIVKFNMDGSSARQQVGTYLATAHTLAGQHVTPSQYIDVRVLGRAYYK